MKLRIASLAVSLGCLSAYAGEIVIIRPADDGARSVREQSRSERELGRTMDKARDHAGTANGPVIIDDRTGSRAAQNAEQAIRDAEDYLRPGSGAATAPNSGGTTVILRTAPTEPERLRQKARSYNAPDGGGRATTLCGEVANTVGTIGNERATTVIEKGNSVVIVNCK